MQTFIYLCAAFPNQLYKLFSCYSKPEWYGWLMGPSIYCHWLILLISQSYFFAQCPCSAWGCFYPGSYMMLLGEACGRPGRGVGRVALVGVEQNGSGCSSRSQHRVW